MKQYKLINNMLGWAVFAVALVTYTLTLESTASFWDCGEFISGAYKLQVVHPPGAPVFLLLGRVFTMFAPDPSQVAFTINFMSGLASAFGILFLFWIITALAKKLVIGKDQAPPLEKIIAVMGAGAVGALSCTFSDTYWFSAVEGEVYALSTALITLVFWCMMKWESSDDEKFRDKWLVLIAFLMGLSTGVHLMSLLAIPAMSLVYYFKKYTPTWKGALVALLVGFGMLMFIFVGMVSVLINVVASFDLFFVNTLSLPFGSGAVSVAIIIIGGLVAGIFYAIKKGNKNLHTALMSIVMILIGFSIYVMVVIRAVAVPPIDMNKPADIFRLQSYLNREQYGSRPLMFGPHYNAYPTKVVQKGKKHYKGEDKYIVIGDRIGYEFDKKDMMFFPRLGSWQDNRHVKAYGAMLGLKKDEDPSFGDNMRFFVNYQVMFMWFRYFMWNFSGRQDDIQGRFDNNHGHWLSGFQFLDEMRLGPQGNLPDKLENNKARNIFFMIPFLLGIIGVIYQYVKDVNDAIVVITLFMFTGLIEIIFFNSPPFEPRERDYTLVGSFVTYCIWIGFGVLALYDFLRKKMPGMAGVGVAIMLGMVAPILMASDGWDDHDRSDRYTARDFAVNYLESCAPNAIIFTQGDNDTYPLWYVQEVENIRPDIRVVNMSLLGVDWYIEQLQYKINEADAVKLVHTPEKYLGNRRDVTRYYDNKKTSKKKSYELLKIIKYIASDDHSTQVQTQGGEFINFSPTKNLKITVDKNRIKNNKVVPEHLYGDMVDEMTFKIKKNNLLKNNLMVLDIVASNLWERPIYFAVSVSPDSYNGLQKYFQLEGLAYRIVPIEKKESGGGHGYVALDIMFDNVVNKFKWGGIEKKEIINYKVQSGDTRTSIMENFDISGYELNVANAGKTELQSGTTLKIQKANDLYLDENILRMTMNLRSNFARLAEALIKAGKKEKAKIVLDRCLEVLPRQSVPFNIFMVRFPELYYKLGDKERARDLMRTLAGVFEQDLIYYTEVKNFDPASKRNSQQALAVMQELLRLAKNYNDKEIEDELSQRFAVFQGAFRNGRPS